MTLRLWSPMVEPKRLIAASGAIFVVDIAARLLLWLVWPGEQTDILFGLCAYGVVLVVSMALGFFWTRRYLIPQVAACLAVVAVPSAIAVGVLGPLASGDMIAQGGATITVLRVLLTVAVVAAGAIVGVLGAVALGLDPTSRAWRAQAERVLAKRRASK
jgi:hypothetical protein